MRLLALAIVVLAFAILGAAGAIGCAIAKDCAPAWLCLVVGLFGLAVSCVRFGNVFIERESRREFSEILESISKPHFE